MKPRPVLQRDHWNPQTSYKFCKAFCIKSFQRNPFKQAILLQSLGRTSGPKARPAESPAEAEAGDPVVLGNGKKTLFYVTFYSVWRGNWRKADGFLVLVCLFDDYIYIYYIYIEIFVCFLILIQPILQMISWSPFQKWMVWFDRRTCFLFTDSIIETWLVLEFS